LLVSALGEGWRIHLRRSIKPPRNQANNTWDRTNKTENCRSTILELLSFLLDALIVPAKSPKGVNKDMRSHLSCDYSLSLSCPTIFAEARCIRHRPEEAGQSETPLLRSIHKHSLGPMRTPVPKSLSCSRQRPLDPWVRYSRLCQSPRFEIQRVGHAVSRINDYAVTAGSYLGSHQPDLSRERSHLPYSGCTTTRRPLTHRTRVTPCGLPV
jgi:hypothetical protein